MFKLFLLIIQLTIVISVPKSPALSLERRPDSHSINSVIKNSKLTNDFSDLVRDFKKIRSKRSKDDVYNIVTVSLVASTIQIEKSMRENLANISQNFYDQFNTSTVDEIMDRLLKVEEIMERDKRAIEILSNILDYTRNVKNYTDFIRESEKISRENKLSVLELEKKRILSNDVEQLSDKQIAQLIEGSNGEIVQDLNKKVYDVKHLVNDHIRSINKMLSWRVRDTISFVKSRTINRKDQEHNGRQNVNSEIRKRKVKRDIEDFSGTINNSSAMSDEEATKPITIHFPEREKEEVEDIADEFDGNGIVSESESAEDGQSGGGGGGLVGLIAGLSGGEGGSDVGALVGALTGVITNLFGPNGLDIPSLLGSGTALIAGLLGGKENFGKVLGGYVGTAVDGLSGGGGAIANGQFFGQLIGTVIAQLSADPEDEDLPIQPKIFLENVLSGVKKATAKADNGDKPETSGGGSDAFGFITNIISSIVSGITSTILQSLLGSSGGSSKGSGDSSSGSSGSSSSSSSSQQSHSHHHHHG